MILLSSPHIIVGMKLALPRASEHLEVRIVRRKLDNSGNPIGMENPNPIQNTREYNVELFCKHNN